MTPDQYQRISKIFEEACALEPSKRAAFVESACGGDERIRTGVEALLRNDEHAEGFIRDAADRVHRDAAQVVAATVSHVAMPAMIGSYRILELLGEGGMGLVYKAQQEQPQRTVALKVIRPGLMSESALRRFEYEAQVLGQLRHPGIAQVYEAGAAIVQTDHGPVEQRFFAMEYIEGDRLDAYAKRTKADTRQRLALLAAVCDAVHHAHQKGVIHRDLKPGNILVEESAHGTIQVQPKVLDFGIARATDADMQAVTQQTDVGQLVGTIPYMSPEQVTGLSSEVDTRSDVYALGVILYELLAGKLPHDVGRRSIPEAVRIIRDESFTRLSSISRTLRGDVETIVSKALEKDKERRYASAAEFAADIRRFLGDEPIVARPPSTTYQLRKFAKRNKGLVAGVVTAFLALAIGLAASTGYAIKANRQSELARLEAQRASRRFDQVHQLAHAFIFDFYDRIENLPGSTSVREYLVTTALQYLDDLAEEAADSTELQLELVDAYNKIGDVQGMPNNANLGDSSGALASYEKGLQILRPLLAGDETNFEVTRRMALTHANIGDIKAAMGDTVDALAEYQAYIAVVEPLHKKEPDRVDLQQMMSIGHNQLGRVFKTMGRLEESLDRFRKSLTLREAVARADPGNVRSQREVTVGYNKIGDIQLMIGELDAALTSFGKSHELRLARARSEPQNTRAQRDVAFTYGRLGNTLLSMGRLDEALANFVESQEIRKAIAEADPNNVNAMSDLAVGYYRIGDLQLSAGQPEEAIASFRLFFDLARSLVASDPENINYRNLEASGYFVLGETLAALGDSDTAMSNYQDAKARRITLVEDNPANTEHRRNLATDNDRIARSHLRTGDTNKALEHHRHALEIRESLAQRDSDDIQAQVDLAETYAGFGEVHMAVAANAAGPSEDGAAAWIEANTWLERSQGVLLELRRAGNFRPGDADILERTENGIAKCQEALADTQHAGGVYN